MYASLQGPTTLPKLCRWKEDCTKKIRMRSKRKLQSKQKCVTLVAYASWVSLFLPVMQPETLTAWEAFFFFAVSLCNDSVAAAAAAAAAVAIDDDDDDDDDVSSPKTMLRGERERERKRVRKTAGGGGRRRQKQKTPHTPVLLLLIHGRE